MAVSSGYRDLACTWYDLAFSSERKNRTHLSRIRPLSCSSLPSSSQTHCDSTFFVFSSCIVLMLWKNPCWFLRLWHTVPPHIRRIDFALDAAGWDPAALDALSTTLTTYADVFSSSKLDYGECSLRPFEIKVPPGTQPIQSRPYRLNPVLSKQADAILDSYLAAGLIQHSTSPWSSPLVCVPKKSGGIRITVNYQKLNKLTEIPQIAIPRVDEVLDTLGGGSVFSVFDLFSEHFLCCVYHRSISGPSAARV